MRLTGPSIKRTQPTIRLTRRRAKSCRLLTILFVLSLALPAAATADNGQITISIQQSDRREGSTAKATLYLKRLIEQRTDHRIELTVKIGSITNRSAKNQPSPDIRMAVVDTKHQAEAIAQQFGPNMQRIASNTDGGYRLFINIDVWNRLSDELKIILRGAADDTLSYLSELSSKS